MNPGELVGWHKRMSEKGTFRYGRIYAEHYEYETACIVMPHELPRELCWDDFEVRRSGIRVDPSE